jgi:hypothetical protein
VTLIDAVGATLTELIGAVLPVGRITAFAFFHHFMFATVESCRAIAAALGGGSDLKGL